jgi:predicted nucleic acid-binding protein
MKVVLDTNVWIGFLRGGQQKDEFESGLRRPQILLSSVVAMELFAGCRTARQRKAMESLLKPFEKANRVVTPDAGCFRDAGRVLARMGEDGLGATHRQLIVADVLIAVSATRAGAVVLTSNFQDFSKIERYTPVRWMLPG